MARCLSYRIAIITTIMTAFRTARDSDASIRGTRSKPLPLGSLREQAYLDQLHVSSAKENHGRQLRFEALPGVEHKERKEASSSRTKGSAENRQQMSSSRHNGGGAAGFDAQEEVEDLLQSAAGAMIDYINEGNVVVDDENRAGRYMRAGTEDEEAPKASSSASVWRAAKKTKRSTQRIAYRLNEDWDRKPSSSASTAERFGTSSDWIYRFLSGDEGEESVKQFGQLRSPAAASQEAPQLISPWKALSKKEATTRQGQPIFPYPDPPQMPYPTDPSSPTDGIPDGDALALVLPLLILLSTLLFVLLIFVVMVLVVRRHSRISLSDIDGPSDILRDEEDSSLQIMAERESRYLESIDDATRQGYVRGRDFVLSNPPASQSTDITLSQFLSIQEKGVSAWSFDPDYESNPSVFVEARTEITFLADGAGMAPSEGGGVCVQSNLPLPKLNEVYYWEVKMMNKPEATNVAVGLTTKPYPSFRFPGEFGVMWDEYDAFD